ncbi:MAG: TIGR00341 family protein [Rikenellaceae bacterium]|nr:TIGR00341 family protein [Rikenellaceae bacterium]
MSNRSPHHLSEALRSFLRSRFDLSADKASEEEVVDNIRKGVEFKGTNLWVLIFATFVASLGLNVNSTAVIIGAMLISPLMGPIMGMGLSVGINDFELLKRSLRNFGFMVLASIFTSTLYFFISPLSGAQSELLARTTPTTYDVLIAFFGGLAGIVAQSRKDRTSTVIPGVAIATALMPPLCTAGFGLATLQFKYFIGAFYLFFINTVFIAIATFIVVRFLHYSKKEFVDKNREMRVRRSILLIVLVTIIPSVVIGYRIVKRSLFENDVKRYVNTVFQFPKTKVIEHTGIYRPDNGESYVEIYLIGEPISDEMIENARLQMPQYNLRDIRLVVRQSGETDNLNFSTLQTGYQELLSEKNIRIRELETKLSAFATDTLAVRDITVEMRTLVPDLHDVTLSKAVRYNTDKTPADTLVLCVMHLNKGKKLAAGERERIEQWLRVRTKTDSLKLYTE